MSMSCDACDACVRCELRALRTHGHMHAHGLLHHCIVCGDVTLISEEWYQVWFDFSSQHPFPVTTLTLSYHMPHILAYTQLDIIKCTI